MKNKHERDRSEPPAPTCHGNQGVDRMSELLWISDVAGGDRGQDGGNYLVGRCLEKNGHRIAGDRWIVIRSLMVMILNG